MENVNIAQNIKKICETQSISITKLLIECEITKSLIYDLEKRDRTPSIKTMSKIAQYLNVSIDYLVGYTPQVDTQPLSNDLLSDEQDLLKLYLQLNEADRGEVRGMVKQMLKGDKYLDRK